MSVRICPRCAHQNHRYAKFCDHCGFRFGNNDHPRPILHKKSPSRWPIWLIFSLGAIALAFSMIYASPILAFIGLGLVLWGVLAIYTYPTKRIKLELLNATVSPILANIEKVMAKNVSTGKGIYLPPQRQGDSESSFLFVPLEASQTLPKHGEIEKLDSKGMFLTPIGLDLSRLFEKELGTPFTRTDLNYIQKNLPKLLIEELEAAENVEIRIESATITIEIANHIFNEVCMETRKLQNVHRSLGCPLCSAIACALVKATGKPITVEKEEQSQDGRTTRIQYRVLEDWGGFIELLGFENDLGTKVKGDSNESLRLR